MEISAKRMRGELLQRVEELSGQAVFSCNQCGKCSGGCPIAAEMDLLPNQVIRLIQLGQEDRALNSRTIWLCASCLTCDSRCPRGIDISRIMESLRVMRLRKGLDFLDIPKISPEFLTLAPQQAFVSGFRKYAAY
jgi:heterodisulfide reductase subunit C